MTFPTRALAFRLRSGTWPVHSLASVGLVLLVILLVYANAPAPVRILCLPVLVLTPGAALVRLLLGAGRAPGALGDVEPPADRATDPAVRIPLSVVLGILVCLFVTLTLDILGIRITATSLALGVGTVSALVTASACRGLIAGRRQLISVTEDRTNDWIPEPPRATGWRRSVAAAVGAGLVLAAAVSAARMLQPHHEDLYTSLGFDDSKPYSAEQHVVAAGAPVRLNWMMRGFGYDFSTSLTSVQVRIDGEAVEDVAVDLGPVTGPDIPGSTGVMKGAVTFPAPLRPGRHSVELLVLPASDRGETLPAPGFLTTFMEVEE